MHKSKRTVVLEPKQNKKITLCNCMLSYEPYQQNNECMVGQSNVKFII